MRKVLLMLVLASVAFSGVYAQKVKELEDVQEKVSKGKYDEAKEKIDKYLADPKNQAVAQGWYWKGNVYSGLAKADSSNQLSYDAAREAFEAYKKYQQMDPKNIYMTLEQNVGLFILRDVYANKGDYFWNQKNYAKAFENYKNALEVEEYIVKKNFTYNNFAYPALDTSLVRYTAAAAYSAKMEDESIPYFERLADAKIKEKDFKDIYGLLVQYHNKKGNSARSDKYLAIGKELFPDEDYWLGIEIGDMGNDKAKRLARLEELYAKYPSNPALALDYAIDLRNHTYIFETKPADYGARKAKYYDVLKKAVELNPKSELASYLLSEHIYIDISDVEEDMRAVRGNTPADQAKKKQFVQQIDQKYEDLLAASSKAYDLYAARTDLKIQDKANFRKVINQLIDYYTRKKNTERVAFYQGKLKTVMN